MRKNLRISYDEIHGAITPPPSKSYSQRYILMASFLPGKKFIRPVGHSDDEKAALGIAQSCGMKVRPHEDGVSIEGKFSCPETLNCGESGTSFRLVHGLLFASGCRTTITVQGNLSGRPMGPLLDVLREHGYVCRNDDGIYHVDASARKELSHVSIDGSSSSQFVSSVMLAMSIMKGNRSITMLGKRSSGGYIRITSDVLENLGIKAEIDDDKISIYGSIGQMNGTYRIERDYSSSAFLIGLGLLCSEKGITVRDLPYHSAQPDSSFVEILGNLLHVERHENTVDITASRKDSIPHFEVDVDRCPDLAPPLSIIGMFSRNGMSLRNSERLDLKESRRLSAILEIADRLGSVVEHEDDYIMIRRGNLPEDFKPVDYHDHRMSMAQFIACAALKDNFLFPETGDVSKSYPDFFQHMQSIGFNIMQQEE
jgi:3-phosphoshikimate 1-carboxyvinyltransferase